MKNSDTKNMIDLSIILLNYKTKDLTLKAIETIYASKIGSYRIEVILCDNASEDGIADAVKHVYPNVIFIQNGGNIGFSAGNNPGIKRSKGRYVLLLNTDTEVHPETLSGMLSYMDNTPTAGASTCKLFLMDGTIDPACHRGIPTPWRSICYMIGLSKIFPTSPLFSGYHLGYLDRSTIHQVDVISGAFFLIRRKVIDKIGMLDEDYLMYGEDMDWCMRITDSGWKIMYNPKYHILHKKKQSGRAHSEKARRIKTMVMFYESNKLFFKKNFHSRYPRFVMNFLYMLFDIRVFSIKNFGI